MQVYQRESNCDSEFEYTQIDIEEFINRLNDVEEREEKSTDFEDPTYH